ncbi:unnamed protein product [Heterobilharzia americana]|nr:unnamed protein product [Heterobilharzia americana]
MNRLPLLMASSVIAVSAFTMFSLAKWFKNSQVEKESSKISSHFTANDTSLSKVTEFDKENLSLGFATCLCSLIKVSDYNTRQNLIMCLHEASSFCQNFVAIIRFLGNLFVLGCD